jgi:hypothetical protein
MAADQSTAKYQLLEYSSRISQVATEGAQGKDRGLCRDLHAEISSIGLANERVKETVSGMQRHQSVGSAEPAPALICCS